MSKIRYFVLSCILVVLIAACSKNNSDAGFADLPDGDATRGDALFSETINGSPSCSTCHRLDDVTQVGPGLADYAARAEGQVDGQSAAEYSYESITRPAKHLVSGFSNVMYNQYDENLTPQQIADLVAYLLTL